MPRIHGRILRWLRYALPAIAFVASGCQLASHGHQAAVDAFPPVVEPMPRELAKTVLPQYVIEPPDILAIETIHAVPKPPYHLKSLDVLS
ncbi:MAG: hypothetical protein AB7F89_19975, partial [Pirellulaceae bacterium]